MTKERRDDTDRRTSSPNPGVPPRVCAGRRDVHFDRGVASQHLTLSNPQTFPRDRIGLVNFWPTPIYRVSFASLNGSFRRGRQSAFLVRQTQSESPPSLVSIKPSDPHLPISRSPRLFCPPPMEHSGGVTERPRLEKRDADQISLRAV